MIQSLLIDGTPINELPFYTSDKISVNNPPFIFNDVLQPGYQDITSIENIANYGELTNKDYKFVRTEMKKTFYSKINYNINNIGNLTHDELHVVSKFMLVPKEIRLTVLSEDEDLNYSFLFNKNVTKSRQDRYEFLMPYLYTNMSLADCQKLITKLRYYVIDGNTVDLVSNYITYGLEGLSEGDAPGLYDCLASTPNTIFENNGLLQIELTSYNDTISNLSLRILEILRDGKYNKDILVC